MTVRPALRLLFGAAAAVALAWGHAGPAAAQLSCGTAGTSTAFAVGACLTIDNTIFAVQTYSLNTFPGGVTNNLGGALLQQDGSNFGIEVVMPSSATPLLSVSGGAQADWNITFEVQNANTASAAPLSTVNRVGFGMSGSASSVGTPLPAINGTETISGGTTSPPPYSVGIDGLNAAPFVKSATFTNFGTTEIR